VVLVKQGADFPFILNDIFIPWLHAHFTQPESSSFLAPLLLPQGLCPCRKPDSSRNKSLLSTCFQRAIELAEHDISEIQDIMATLSRKNDPTFQFDIWSMVFAAVRFRSWLPSLSLA